MLKEDHNKILKEFLDEARELQPRNGVRLFVEGSPLDNLQLYEIIESCNATIISEDNCWGNRHRARTSMSTDPMEAIADRYHFKSLCPFMYPMEAKVKYCVQSALEAKVNGVILNIIECDYAQAWETSDEIKALEAQGIPTLCLNKQPYLLSDNDHAIIKTSVDAFVSRLRYK
jgi:benzoyl-CoA reductase/2-hydroxyglutaryl-CoA dehydratase subunit BcrC/BadD/HgdB